MSGEEIDSSDHTTADGLIPLEPVIPALPMVRNEGGLEIIDWNHLLPEKATLATASSLIMYEVEALANIDDLHARERADRVSRAGSMMLDRVESGHLATMSDVANIIDFVADNNPSLKRVGELFDAGHSMEEISQIYDGREIMNVSIGTVDVLCETFGFAYDDTDMLNALSDAIDAVIENKGLDPRFRDIGAQLVIKLAEEGKTLADIFDLSS